MYSGLSSARTNFEPPFDRAKHKSQVKDTPTANAIPVPVKSN